jgi:hypothetical protein
MIEQTHAICDRVAEAQMLLDEHRYQPKTSDAELIHKLRALFDEEGLRRAMHAVGYFPPDTPPSVLIGIDA